MSETIGQLVARVERKKELQALLDLASLPAQGIHLYNLRMNTGRLLLGWFLHQHSSEGGYDTDWAEWRTVLELASGNQLQPALVFYG